MNEFEQLQQLLQRIGEDTYLHQACQALLDQFGIKYTPISPANLPVDVFLTPQFISSNKDIVSKIREVCVVGIATQNTFDDSAQSSMTVEELDEKLKQDRYQEMAFFSIDTTEAMTRTEVASLTRVFNRRMVNRPVILFIRNGNLLTLSTCERTAYVRTGYRGEKAGKVTILRNIDCANPHRGHLEILNALNLSSCSSFDELYAKWLETFSNELLTKKFYNELSDWYAWAVQVAKFPNDITTEEDDTKFNHESCIRLITRLIFVWFLKQKKLIPDEFFDEQYIRENLIENFNPHGRKDLYYDADESKYYRLVLQNLFFAMLNRSIVPEGKDTPNNRRFRAKVTNNERNADYNVNNLMRYEQEFMAGGPEKFVALANSSVPFLNGGLFDCLDDKPRKLYYDGFSEHPDSLAQLSLPDYLFFGDEVGKSIDLSQWYDDRKKKNVSARGIIDILKRYSFTIEENTPLDQEVSLDPELLGKVFENLLAAFNPETKQSARKQTGSFYTPREIVQYMVDESLVAHLKRKCGDELEQKYRDLLSYSTDEVKLTDEQRKNIMNALYNCRVLDPACGSGAFPMGMLQQMVHVLKRIDPSNEKWKELVLAESVAATEKAFTDNLNNRNLTPDQKLENDKILKERTTDIEASFNARINYPDYARKLYLIEHCIYGVDIQPIATQISKLRFFISLVVDQKPTNDAKSNFGIRPLPNLEAKFVTANTLIPLDRSRSLFTSTDDIRFYEGTLRDLSHRIFLAKRNKDKQELRQQMVDIRKMMAQTLENLKAIGRDGYAQLTEWDMFDQNASASFFDPEWMFGVKEGFDVVIANPPYVNLANIKPDEYRNVLKGLFVSATNKSDLYAFFIEKAFKLLKPNGYLCYIVPHTWKATDSFKALRTIIFNNHSLCQVVNLNMGIFDAIVKPMIILIDACHRVNYSFDVKNDEFDVIDEISIDEVLSDVNLAVDTDSSREMKTIFKRIEQAGGTPLKEHIQFSRGVKTSNDSRFVLLENRDSDCKKVYRGRNIKGFQLNWVGEYLWYRPELMREKVGCVPHSKEFFEVPEKIITQRVNSSYQLLVAYDDKQQYFLDTVNVSNYSTWNKTTSLLYLCGLLNSKLINFWYCNKYRMPTIGGYELHSIPIKVSKNQQAVVGIVKEIIELRQNIEEENEQVTCLKDQLDHLIYHIYGLTYDEVLVIDPETSIVRREYDSFNLDI